MRSVTWTLRRDGGRELRSSGWRRLLAAGAAALATVALVLPATEALAQTPGPAEYIVSGVYSQSSSNVSAAVTNAGGSVVGTLGVGSMLAASLTPSQVATLQANGTVTVTPDVAVSVQGGGGGSHAGTDDFLQQTGAPTLWATGDTGSNINVALLDTGIDGQLPDFAGRLVGGVDLTGGGNPFDDAYGHGTFVAGLIAGNGASSAGTYEGEAPGAGLVSIKVAGASGSTDLATVIQGVGWAIAHEASLDIRVLNMSLGFQPFQSTVFDPLDQAVQQAWDAGIVVVVSAGNAGPFNGTILSPGDDPLVITAGAVDDGAQTNPALDTVPSFSSVGPTAVDGWVKPDLAAPGRSVVSLRDPGSTIDTANPSARIGSANFVGSGTSFSSAITAGAAALLLADHPYDTPDQVKAALLASTNPGPVGNPFVDGHGILDVAAAAALGTGADLNQVYGDVAMSGAMHSTALTIEPGDTIAADYQFSMPGTHPAASVSVQNAMVSLPVTCVRPPLLAPMAGTISVPLTGSSYGDPANANGLYPSAASLPQGSVQAPNLCNGGPMYAIGGQFRGELVSSDGTDPVALQFAYFDTTVQPLVPGASAATSTLTPVLSQSSGFAQLALQTSWSQSSWNPSNWTGISTPPVVQDPPIGSGLSWSGSAWNGSAWNGSAWNGSAWNGSAWNGSAWNGSAWNGSAWNGSAWNGAAWSGSAWNGSSWS